MTKADATNHTYHSITQHGYADK